MKENLELLASVASAPIVACALSEVHVQALSLNDRTEELFQLLSAKNGFYAFESALHVLPLTARGSAHNAMSLLEWNSPHLWRDGYNNELVDILFFAEDVFGVQFGIQGTRIVTFDPESGERTQIAATMDEWARLILRRYPEFTGFTLAHAWQELNGPLPAGRRLLPKRPFILGGTYSVDNLAAVDAVRGMRYRAEVWRQIRDLPDGAQVKLHPLPLH